MNILVSGAAGFIGSHLSEQLAGSSHQVFGIDCLTDYYSHDLKASNIKEISGKGVRFETLDLGSGDLKNVLQDIDVIYHLAAQPGISATTPFNDYLTNNIIATQRLLEEAKKSSRLQLFVNISTSSVYGRDASGNEQSEPLPTSWYGVTKLAAEQLVMAAHRDQGLPACSLRLFSVYGPRERPEKLYPRLIDSIFKNKEFPLYEGSEKHIRSYTYIEDIIIGLTAVLTHMKECQGEIINIGTDKTITTGQGIKIVEQIIGKPAKIIRGPKRPGDQEKTHANIEKARRILNYRPTVKPSEGLQEEVRWYKQLLDKNIRLYP